MKQYKRGVPQRIAGVLVVLALCGGVGPSVADGGGKEVADENPTRVLLASIFRLEVGSQVAQRADALAADADTRGVIEITAAVDAFRSGIGERLRTDLEVAFGGSAREIFGAFVGDFSQAEHDEQLDFLERIVTLSELWGDDPPKTYAALRAAMIEDVLTDDLGRAGAFLADLQTWLDLRKRQEDVPPLRNWLDRGIAPDAAEMSSPSLPRKKRNPLREAEARADVFEGGEDDAGGALEQFGAARTERRRKALEEARAGMQQVAEERRTAEEEEAAKTIAAAQAEAEAARKHAEKLAVAEGEAIEQRRNSWGNRLKSVLTTTIGATSGAFLGHVGSRAGEAAADAVFDTEGRHGRGGRHYR